MKSNIIFLDVDGVLNYDKYVWEHERAEKICICPDLAEKVKQFAIRSNSKIVISSSWRRSDIGMKALQGIYGDLIIGKTTEDPHMSRSIEIELWWNEHKNEYNHFVVLDDWDLGFKPGQPFIIVDHMIGICDQDLFDAMLYLCPEPASNIIKKFNI